MKKILIVDDSSSWLTFHQNAIEEVFIEINNDNYAIDMAQSARDGYNFLMSNVEVPYDLIVTDLQMEEDFAPKYAGEWFVEQVRTFKKYVNTKIIISSGCNNIKQIAENLSVDYIPKRVAVTDINLYKAKLLPYLKG